jgi:hypothetical protein
MEKPYPVKRKLSYLFEGDDINGNLGTGIISLPRDLSAANRRLYRMNNHYGVEGMRISIPEKERFDDSSQLVVEVSVLPDTWLQRNAITEGFEQHQEMQKSVTDVHDRQKGRWADWRVYFDRFHGNGDYVTLKSEPNQHYGEWDYSDYTFLDNDGSTIITQHAYAMGDSEWDKTESKFSLLTAYKNLLQTPKLTQLPNSNDPTSLVAKSPYAQLGARHLGNAGIEIVEDMIEEGGNPPYSTEYFTPDREVIFEGRMPSNGRSIAIPPFIAPLGYVRINVRDDANTGELLDDDFEMELTVNVAGGSYKGVLAA